MSDDIRLCIMEWGCGWYGWHGSTSRNYYEPDSYDYYFPTKQLALEWAENQIKQSPYLKDKLIVINLEEQKLGLIDLINEAGERLSNLYRWNTQFPINNDLNFR